MRRLCNRVKVVLFGSVFLQTISMQDRILYFRLALGLNRANPLLFSVETGHASALSCKKNGQIQPSG